jgi:prolyl 4-hydroxylase
MDTSFLAEELMHAAVGGVSKSLITRTFKEQHGCTEEEVEQLIRLCRFKSKPDRIDYDRFYDIPLTLKAKKYCYPFTQLYEIAGFLPEKDCEKLIELADGNLRPSTVADPTDTGTVNNYRTSRTADFNCFTDPLFLSVDKRITQMLGLYPFLGETMQAQKYEIGQYYKEHWDFFNPITEEYKTYCEWMGQRTWTAMIYLNDVKEGGETYFKHLKLRIKPKKGTLIAWNNLYRNGLPNMKTMHEACPPVSGPKYVITKWFRSWSLI